jgi:hypothetical protein
MRVALALTLALAAGPAQAHCFSRWFYPWPQPQSCRSTPARQHHLWIAEAPAPTSSPAPITVTDDETLERAQAIEALRVELRKAEALKLELHDIGSTQEDNKHGD